MEAVNKDAYRLTIFREGNKTAKHIPEFLDFKLKEHADEQIKANKLDQQVYSREMLKIENEQGECIAIPRHEFVGYQLKKILI